MGENEQIVDQTILAEDVSSKIPYQTFRMFLVKPLDPIMVEKEFSTPVAESAPKKDENGIEAADYNEVAKEIKTVESDFRKGIVLKVPEEYAQRMKDEKYPAPEIKIGDVVVFRSAIAQWFDICKDTLLVDTYSILAKEK